MSNNVTPNSGSLGFNVFDPLGLRGADSNGSNAMDQASPSGGASLNLLNNTTGSGNLQNQNSFVFNSGGGLSRSLTHSGGGLTNSVGNLNNSVGSINNSLGGVTLSPSSGTGNPIQSPPPPITSNYGGQQLTADQILSLLGQQGQGILNHQTSSQSGQQGSQQGSNPQTTSNQQGGQNQQQGGQQSLEQNSQQLMNLTCDLLNILATLQNIYQTNQGQGSVQNSAQNQQNPAALLQTLLSANSSATGGSKSPDSALGSGSQQVENPLPNNMFSGIFNSISNLNGGPNAFPPNFPLPPFEAPSSPATSGIQSQQSGIQSQSGGMRTAASGIAAGGVQTASSGISAQSTMMANQQNVSMRMPSNHSINSNQSLGHSQGQHSHDHNQGQQSNRKSSGGNNYFGGSSRDNYNSSSGGNYSSHGAGNHPGKGAKRTDVEQRSYSSHAYSGQQRNNYMGVNSSQENLLNNALHGNNNQYGGGSAPSRASSYSIGQYNQSHYTQFKYTGSATHPNTTTSASGADTNAQTEAGGVPEDCPETLKKGLYLKTIRGKFRVPDYLRSVEEGDPRIDPTHPDYVEVIARKHARGEKYSISDEIDLSTLLRLEQSQYMEANSRPVYTLFIFRRDFRIQDNSGFLYCCFNFQNVLPCFIFTPEQIYENLYYNPFGLNFLMESLSELDGELRSQGSRLHLFYGDNVAVLTALSCKIRIANICYNRDWSPYARERDALIRTFCHHRNITLHETEDYLLRGLGTFLNYSGEANANHARQENDQLTKGNQVPLNLNAGMSQNQNNNDPHGLTGTAGQPTTQNPNGVEKDQGDDHANNDENTANKKSTLTNQSLMSLANANAGHYPGNSDNKFDPTTQNVYSISRKSKRTPSDLTSSSNTGNRQNGSSNNADQNPVLRSDWSSASSSFLDEDPRAQRSVGVCYTTFTEFKANALCRKVKRPIYLSDNMKNLSALPEISRDMSKPWSEKNLFLHQMENRVVQKYVAGMGSLASLLLRVKEFANIVDRSHPRHQAFASIPWPDLECGVEVVRQNYKIAEAPISSLRPRGGRLAGIARLGILTRTSRRYHRAKNTLVNPSSQLAAYLRFGCVSVREIYFKMLETNDVEDRRALVTGLYWREFYTYICFYLPETFLGKEQGEIRWVNNQSYLDAWCRGRTGYPIVDAGIQEMLQTTHMHMRTRLITAFFLSRVLGIHWRYGENFFAAHLIDYDPAINNGNWQWISAIGVNAKPHNQQVYNPWTQSSKHDPQARYIKKWLPQLRSIPPKELHAWNRYYSKYDLKALDYVAPIVNYSEARLKDVERFSDLMSSLGYDTSNAKEAKDQE